MTECPRPPSSLRVQNAMRRRFYLLALVLFGAGLALSAYWFTTDSVEAKLNTSVTVADAMNNDTTGYRRATEIREFSFPRDHGPHPGFKNEWWYVTGNLSGPDGRPFGYELTIFRFALAPPSEGVQPVATEPSGWRSDQLYMGHLAVTDAAGDTFHHFERFARGGAGLAGGHADPFRVWLEDWSMERTGTSPFPIRLRAQQEGTGIDVTVRPVKPMVRQGDRGLSQKGPGRGNASYYYSYTRLDTKGHVVVDGDTTQVSGRSWMDREWSTSALGPEQAGWDWFALQLNDGRDLMYYRLRSEDGSASPYSEGTLVDADGSSRTIDREAVVVEVLDTWTSPDGTHTYPIEWRLRVPSANLNLRIVPYLRNQELNLSVRYWEGMVRVEGANGEQVGRGYVELTGYGKSPGSPAS